MDSYKTPMVQLPAMTLLFSNFLILSFITWIRLLYHLLLCSLTTTFALPGWRCIRDSSSAHLHRKSTLTYSAAWSSHMWVNVFDFKCMKYWHALLLQHLLLTELHTGRATGVTLSRVSNVWWQLSSRQPKKGVRWARGLRRTVTSARKISRARKKERHCKLLFSGPRKALCLFFFNLQNS